MKQTWKLFVLITLCIGYKNTIAQDIHYSQFFTSPVLLNPAAAGAKNSDFRFVLNYRNQWKSVISPFQTMALAFDSRFYPNKKKKDSHFGYGITMFNDKAGLSKLTTNQFNIDLAYHISFDRRNRFSIGFKTGFFQKSINTSDLKWDSQFDGKTYNSSLSTNENTVYQSLMKFDLGIGGQYTYVNTAQGILVEAGASMAHLTKPKLSFYSNDPSINYKYIGHVNVQTKLNSQAYVIPSFMYVQQGKHSEIIGGANVKYVIGDNSREKVILSTQSNVSSAIQFGAFYRYKDALIFMTAIEYKRNIQFGISYDVTLSKFHTASNRRGGIEFSLILLQQKRSRLNSKY